MASINGSDAFHEADLTKAMEHMRPYVSVPFTAREAPRNPTTLAAPTNTDPRSTSIDTEAAKVTGVESDPDVYGIPSQSINPPRHAANARPTSDNPQARTDPFTFGSRLLTSTDDIFSYNAWDHVDPSLDVSFSAFAESQYAMQRSNPVADPEKAKYNASPHKFWDRFYKNNNARFFKDRKWLFQEFPTLNDVTRRDAGAKVLLEVGAGAGNTAFPVLQQNENPALRVHACDYAAKAVELMRGAEAYDEAFMSADVWDVAGSAEDGGVSLPPGLGRESVDVVVLIFIWSALAPSQWEQALRNIWAVMKPGGEVLFRDYGRGDLAQVRFKKGRYLDENFYIRGDGTRVYFFEKEELETIFEGREVRPYSTEDEPEDVTIQDSKMSMERPKFEILNLGVDRRMLVNRQRRLKMYRCWMQGHFRKPHEHTNE